MIRTPLRSSWFFLSALTLGACATTEDLETTSTDVRDEAMEELTRLTGAPVILELNDSGSSKVISMTPGFPLLGDADDPAVMAQRFLAAHHDAFALEAAEANNFVVTRIDTDRAGQISHVTMQRVYNKIPVFQGAITVHLDGKNGVFRALGDESYAITEPSNRQRLSAADAASAAARALGLGNLDLGAESGDGFHTDFAARGTLDPVTVEPRVVHVGAHDDRIAYQVVLSWLDATKQQQYQLALIDAESGDMLGAHNLVNTFTGRVFNANAQPTAGQSADTRSVESFDGDPAASPQGWVTNRTTVGNNAVAATDLDGNNTVGANEIQPTANASDSFDFPYSGTQNASSFRSAAVANAFFLVNDFHDRTYRLGFTEAAGNFQTNNFGKGGAQNDAVNVDVQDGAGTNNANFGTPPDGSRPRMQMFVFTFNGGPTEDGDFDPTVIYHENAHGLSNRLVGGGSTACLNGLQSGGMGEGWGDFMAASFLNNPVIGAYVTGNATRGIRQFPMDTAPWTYGDIKNGTLGEVHDIGELWAATLFDLREALGAAKVEQLVVSGMKLTPCSPSMIQARDAILQADVNINAGANRCPIFTVFAGRLMGSGASSPNHNSTSSVVTSNAVPAECQGGGNVVFTDDFETDKGWTTNAAGTDTATLGQWQRANPEDTTSSGPKQVGTTPSGTNDLVTGAAAGTTAGGNDVDGGTTSIQSPAIAIPAGGTVTLALSFYFAHRSNSSNLDFFRVRVVGSTTTTVIEERGSAVDDDAAFVRQSIDISQFAGQTVRIVVQVRDGGTGSLVEAAVDDVEIKRQ